MLDNKFIFVGLIVLILIFYESGENSKVQFLFLSKSHPYDYRKAHLCAVS